ncbi:MAG TPA: fasciclin domain-containing protein [Phnomibacter sp.]|nr:fasciclin domain-containing protein [Phnomibacter sp.]
MKNIFQASLKWSSVVLAGAMFLASCNKDLEQAKPIVPPPPTATSTIAQLLDDPNFSTLKAAVTRANLMTALADPTASFTVFAPDNAAFTASGIPASAIPTFRPGFLDTLLRYHIIGGERLTAGRITEQFPNMYLQSGFVLQAPSASLPPGYRMPILPSRRTNVAWVNNIPIKAADIQAVNGVVHVPAFIVQPPSQVVAQIIAADTSLTFLLAAVQRADAGPPPGAPQLLPILSNAAANLTVFAPDNNAFRQTLAALGLPPVIGSINLLPTTTVWGIVAYHAMTVRAFAANLPSGVANLPSLIGVPIQSRVTVTPPAPPTLIELRGNGNNLPTNPPTAFFARVTTGDLNAINGVVHKINAVLLPQ